MLCLKSMDVFFPPNKYVEKWGGAVLKTQQTLFPPPGAAPAEAAPGVLVFVSKLYENKAFWNMWNTCPSIFVKIRINFQRTII